MTTVVNNHKGQVMPNESKQQSSAQASAPAGWDKDAKTVRMGLIRKKPDWSIDEFRNYWIKKHGPLAAQAPNLREYWQNHVTDRLQRGIEFKRGPWDFDGFSQLYFDEASQADHAFGKSDKAAALVADEQHFLGGLHILTTLQHVVIPVPAADKRAKLMKRISTLTRLPGTSEDDFRREWIVHRDHVHKMPGVAAYRQNLVVGRERVKGQPCAYEELPIDGIVELWFKDAATLEAAFGSPEGQTTMRHAKSFISEITVFAIEEIQIV